MYKIVRTDETGQHFVWEVRSNPYLAKDDAADYQRRCILPGSTFTVEPATLEDIALAISPHEEDGADAARIRQAADAVMALARQERRAADRNARAAAERHA